MACPAVSERGRVFGLDAEVLQECQIDKFASVSASAAAAAADSNRGIQYQGTPNHSSQIGPVVMARAQRSLALVLAMFIGL
jgi:hypothetical protein